MNNRKFRGLTKEGKWLHGWYAEIEGRHWIILENAEVKQIGAHTIEVIPETVGQSTGFKNWWEGDIFARSSDGKIEGVIIYDLGCFWLDRTRGGRNLLYECVDWSMYKIGNIHQNPKLMEKDNE